MFPSICRILCLLNNRPTHPQIEPSNKSPWILSPKYCSLKPYWQNVSDILLSVCCLVHSSQSTLLSFWKYARSGYRILTLKWKRLRFRDNEAQLDGTDVPASWQNQLDSFHIFRGTQILYVFVTLLLPSIIFLHPLELSDTLPVKDRVCAICL